MCGRFAASASTEEIVETFDVDVVVDEPVPTFNAAPTDPVPAVVERIDRESGHVVRKLVTPRWGLVPSWSKGPGGGARMINARAETVATRPAFAKAFASRRCLVPADGYYEWVSGEGPGGRPLKQPWFIRPAGGGLMALAGIYEFWRDPDAPAPAGWLTTCAVITTTATDDVGRIHDRMPMVVRPRDWDPWLDPHLTDAAAVAGLLSVAPDVSVYRVSTRANSVRNDGPDLIEPLA